MLGTSWYMTGPFKSNRLSGLPLASRDSVQFHPALRVLAMLRAPVLRSSVLMQWPPCHVPVQSSAVIHSLASAMTLYPPASAMIPYLPALAVTYVVDDGRAVSRMGICRQVLDSVFWYVGSLPFELLAP